MNEFLSLKPGVRILAGTSPAQVKTQVAGWFTAAGWQVLNSSTATALDVIPPASQQIGNALAADVLRIQFNPGDITIRTAALIRTPQLARWYVSSSTSATSGSIRIGAQTISASGATGGNDALTGKMFEALRASTAPEARAYTYELITGPGTNDDYIIATEKQVGGGQVVSNASGFTVHQWGDAQAAGSVVDRGAYLGNNALKFTINYGADWVIFLSLTARSMVMAIRTTAGGFLGPYGASWMRNDDAVGQCPAGCAPVELAVTNLSTPGPRFWLRFGHAYAYAASNGASNVYNNGTATGVVDNALPYPTMPAPKGVVAKASAIEPTPIALAGGLNMDTSGSNSSRVADVLGPAAGTALAGLLVPGAQNAATQNGSFQTWTPGAVLPDLAGFFATGDNESTVATRTTTARTTLTAPIDASATTLPLVDASMLAPKGTVIIGSEIINYASKDGNTLQGCERGKASTQAGPHGTNEDVFRAFWWIRINAGALPAGPIDPATLQ